MSGVGKSHSRTLASGIGRLQSEGLAVTHMYHCTLYKMHVVQAKMLKIPKPVLHRLNKNLIFWGFQAISDIFISQKNLLLKSPIYMMILSL